MKATHATLRTTAACAALLGLGAQGALGQEIFTDLPAAPSGFSRDFGAFGDGADLLLSGLSFGVSGTAMYDSNVTQGRGGLAGVGKEDDVILSLGGNVSYRTQGSDFTFGGDYRASYNEYMDNSSLSGFDQNLGLVAMFTGAKLTVTASTNITIDEGANRVYSDYVKQRSYGYNLSASYRYSPKTSFGASLSQSFTDARSGNFSDTESLTANVNAMWQATPLVRVGPGLRYTSRTGDTQRDRTSIGPTLNFDYRLTQKVSLTSQVGIDFSEYDGGRSDESVSARLGLNYRANQIWGMNLSLFRDWQADPVVAGSFNEITTIRLGYNRRIRRATFNAGIGYETNSFDNPTNPGVGTDRDYWTLDASIGMPIFAGTTMASVFTSYSDQSASQGARSYDSFRVGVSLSRQF